MVTRIHKHVKPRLFLKEHRVAKDVSATVMAGRLGIERESVYRIERRPWALSFEKQHQWADALGIDHRDLLRPPQSPPSLDQLVEQAPEDIRAIAADIVKRLVAGRG